MGRSGRAGLLLLLAALISPGPASAASANPLQDDVLERLAKQTGVYNRPASARTPDFIVDPSWPPPLPNNWLLGQVGGLYVDQHDHVWVYNRPRTMTNDEAGLEKALAGATNAQGQPINGLGQLRVNGFGADCCAAAPSVLEFDASGELLRSWGGPADPGFVGGKCKEEEGCIWPNSEHGIYVDHNDNVWIAGNAGNVPANRTPWTTNTHGGDGFVLKFDMNGNFKMRIGGTSTGPASNDTNGGVNGTPLLFQPADMVVDPKTNRLYVADGYGNRRILILDADTGKYIGHFGAYGGNPIDDAQWKAAGLWQDDWAKGVRKPSHFRGPVHCVKIADDGRIYVCDRGNNRIQVFDGNDPNLGKPCSNPEGVVGRCGFVAERWISEKTYTGLMPGSAVSMNFSTDKAQSCLYVGDNTNQTIYILNRQTLEELGRFGRSGRMTGDFHWLHQVSLDSQGNVYTAEVDTGKRIQKFLRYGAEGCSGRGSPTVGGVANR